MEYDPYKKFVELQSQFAAASNALSEIDAEVNPKVLKLIEAHRVQWVAQNEIRDRLEKEIIELAGRHPEWKKGQTIKTQLGTVSYRSGKKLKIHNSEATVSLIKAVIKDESLAASAIKIEESPRAEVLETFDDVTLAKLGVAWEEETTVTVKSVKTDLAKTGKTSSPEAKANAE